MIPDLKHRLLSEQRESQAMEVSEETHLEPLQTGSDSPSNIKHDHKDASDYEDYTANTKFPSHIKRSSRRIKRLVPENQKDGDYWQKRKKNNEAAKKSREVKRQFEMNMKHRLFIVEEQNKLMRRELSVLKEHFNLSPTVMYTGIGPDGKLIGQKLDNQKSDINYEMVNAESTGPLDFDIPMTHADSDTHCHTFNIPMTHAESDTHCHTFNKITHSRFQYENVSKSHFHSLSRRSPVESISGYQPLNSSSQMARSVSPNRFRRYSQGSMYRMSSLSSDTSYGSSTCSSPGYLQTTSSHPYHHTINREGNLHLANIQHSKGFEELDEVQSPSSGGLHVQHIPKLYNRDDRADTEMIKKHVGDSTHHLPHTAGLQSAETFYGSTDFIHSQKLHQQKQLEEKDACFNKLDSIAKEKIMSYLEHQGVNTCMSWPTKEHVKAQSSVSKSECGELVQKVTKLSEEFEKMKRELSKK